MIKVEFVKHPLRKSKRVEKLEAVLQNLEKSGSCILHVTSDKEGYTVVHRSRKELNSQDLQTSKGVYDGYYF